MHSYNPHQPQVYNWELTRSETGGPISSNHTRFYPTLQVDLCDILGETDAAGHSWVSIAGNSTVGNSLPLFGCGNTLREKNLQHIQLYMCPQTDSSSCFSAGQYCCASWGCETIAPWVSQNKDQFLSLNGPSQASCTTSGKCNPVTLTIKQWNEQAWVTGKT